MAATKKQGHVFAKHSGAIAHPSGIGTIRLKKDEAWDADDPLVKARPELFSDEPATPRTSDRKGGRVRVEQATAAPGEYR